MKTLIYIYLLLSAVWNQVFSILYLFLDLHLDLDLKQQIYHYVALVLKALTVVQL